MRYPQAKRDEVVEAHKTGMSYKEISELTGVHEGSICDMIKRPVLPPRRRGYRQVSSYTPDYGIKAFNLRKKGKTPQEISESLGIPKGSVSRLVRAGEKALQSSGDQIIEPPEPTQSPAKGDPLDLFVENLMKVLSGYERLKIENKRLRTEMLKWQAMASKLNEDIYRASAR